jgi:general stress protein 26
MSEFKQLSGTEGLTKIRDLIKGIRIAMLTTAAPDGSFDNRPMAAQRAEEFDGTLWFLTRGESGKVEEIEEDMHVSLIYSDTDDSKYVTVKGLASVSKDRAKIRELWNPMYKAWFPEGEDDPSISVLRVDVQEAEYWEASSSRLVRGVKYLAASVTGGKVDLGEAGRVYVEQ